jgi:hypothetical protein
MLFLHSFSLDTILINKQKVPMDAKRHVLLSSTNSPLTPLTTNSKMYKPAIGYSEFEI